MTNVTSSSSSTEGNVILETTVLSLIICVSVLGNVSLWIVVLSSRTLRNVTNMFILGLSAADLFVATVNMPITVYVIIKGYWNLSETACTVTGYTNMLTLCTSVLSLCNISINRYVMVVKPGKFRDIYTKKKAIAMITGVVLLAALLSALPLLGWAEYTFTPSHSFCFADWKNHMSYAFFMIGCCFLVPFGVMTVCNIIIFRTVRKSRQKVKIAISPASVLDKSRNSAINSEVSVVPNEPEINCSSTDEDGTLQTDETLDEISVDSSRYQELGQGHVEIENTVNESCEEESHNKYKVSKSSLPVRNVEIDEISDDECSRPAVRGSSNSTTSSKRSSTCISVSEEGKLENEMDETIDDDYLSTGSSTETSSLRAYNPAFERRGRTRGRSATRTTKQQYLTIPLGTKLLKESKNLHPTSSPVSDSSLHSTWSEESVKLKPIQLTFDETNVTNNGKDTNLFAPHDEANKKISKQIENTSVITTKLSGILTNNNSPLKSEPDVTTAKRINGVHRKVSINERDRINDIADQSETQAKEKTKRHSVFSSKKHTSPPPRLREEIVLARSLAVIVILFVLCWLPYCISMCLSIFYKGNVPRGFHMFTLLIGYANSGCNPIVYGLMNKRFAHGYKTLFCFWKDHRLSFNSSSM